MSEYIMGTPIPENSPSLSRRALILGGFGAAVGGVLFNSFRGDAASETPCNNVVGDCTPNGSVIVETPESSLITVPTGSGYEGKGTTTTEPEEESTTTEHETTTTEQETTTTEQETTTTEPEVSTTTTTEPEEEPTTTTTEPEVSTTTTTTPGVRPPVNSAAPTK